MKRPSIFYRIKTIHGEELRLLIVSDTFGDSSYTVIVKGTIQNFRFKLNNFKKRIKLSDSIKFCSKELNSELLKVNSCHGPDNDNCQNMCDLLPKLYGDRKKCPSGNKYYDSIAILSKIFFRLR